MKAIDKGHWIAANVYVLDSSVVGGILKCGDGERWEAFGCMDDWQDTPLETHESEKLAQEAVESWVEEYLWATHGDTQPGASEVDTFAAAVPRISER